MSEKEVKEKCTNDGMYFHPKKEIPAADPACVSKNGEKQEFAHYRAMHILDDYRSQYKSKKADFDTFAINESYELFAIIKNMVYSVEYYPPCSYANLANKKLENNPSFFGNIHEIYMNIKNIFYQNDSDNFQLYSISDAKFATCVDLSLTGEL